MPCQNIFRCSMLCFTKWMKGSDSSALLHWKLVPSHLTTQSTVLIYLHTTASKITP